MHRRHDCVVVLVHEVIGVSCEAGFDLDGMVEFAKDIESLRAWLGKGGR